MLHRLFTGYGYCDCTDSSHLSHLYVKGPPCYLRGVQNGTVGARVRLVLNDWVLGRREATCSQLIPFDKYLVPPSWKCLCPSEILQMFVREFSTLVQSSQRPSCQVSDCRFYQPGLHLMTDSCIPFAALVLLIFHQAVFHRHLPLQESSRKMKLPVLMCLLFAGFVLSEVDPTKAIKPARGVFEVRETSQPTGPADHSKRLLLTSLRRCCFGTTAELLWMTS